MFGLVLHIKCEVERELVISSVAGQDRYGQDGVDRMEFYEARGIVVDKGPFKFLLLPPDVMPDLYNNSLLFLLLLDIKNIASDEHWLLRFNRTWDGAS
jgi:hypothetical protein